MKKLCKKLYSWLFDSLFQDFYFLWLSGQCIFFKRKTQDKQGFVVYILYRPYIFFRAFSLEMDVKWAVFWVHFTLFIHKTDTVT